LELAQPDFAMGVPAMKEISDWLEKLGMSEYAERFADNKIDVSVLRHITDQDLKDIGVWRYSAIRWRKRTMPSGRCGRR
jgi:hypothetical protein